MLARHALLALTLAAITPLTTFAQGANVPAEVPVVTTQPAAPSAADVPVRRVILFTSGMGFFEHSGTVAGNAQSEFQFKTDQINDVLKSLVVQDADGGTITGVRYASQQPLAKTLKSFQVDVSANPGLPELLNQIRGAQVTLTLGTEKIAGKIIGVERRELQPATPTEKNTVALMVNLLTLKGIRSLPLNNVSGVELDDDKLQKELNLALEALAQRRDRDKKPVTIDFSGTGKRRVRLGYVVETPVWKTSYRLILPDSAVAPAAKPEAKDAKPSAQIQGWAIVENTTESDWNNIQLSMVGGRPLSFIENLYTSYYVPRPVVQPKTYIPQEGFEKEDGIDTAKLRERFRRFSDSSQSSRSSGGVSAGSLFSNSSEPSGTGAAAELLPTEETERRVVPNGGINGSGEIINVPPNYLQGVAALARTQKVGDSFHFEINNVTLPRQQAAMLPIITDTVDAENASIYNPLILPGNPMHAVKIKNTGKNYLLGGPITVMQTSKSGNAYAGESRISDIPPGQERWLSFAVDQDIKALEAEPKESTTVVSMKIAKGVLYTKQKSINTKSFTFDNRSTQDKSLLIELPNTADTGLTLASPKPEEITDIFYRFRIQIPAGKTQSFHVVTESASELDCQLIADLKDDIISYTDDAATPEPVKKLLKSILAAWTDIGIVESRINDLQSERNQLASDQSRIRENLKAAEKGTDYHTELAKSLQDSDAIIAKLDADLKTLRAALVEKREAAQKLARDSVVD